MCQQPRNTYTRQFFKKGISFFIFLKGSLCAGNYSLAFVALIIPTVPVVGVMQLCTQPQRPIFNLTPSTHSTVFWLHQGNDKIQSGRSSSTFRAWFPPPPKTHPSCLPLLTSSRITVLQEGSWVKKSKGSFPK